MVSKMLLYTFGVDGEVWRERRALAPACLTNEDKTPMRILRGLVGVLEAVVLWLGFRVNVYD